MGRLGRGQGRFDATGNRAAARLIKTLGVSFPDGEKFSQHEDAVAPRADFRPWLIGPIDGDFRDAVAPLAGDVQ